MDPACGSAGESPPQDLRGLLNLLGFEEGETFALAAIRDRKIQPACFTDVEKAEAWLTLHEDWNLYWTPNPVKEGVTGRPKAKDILRSPWLLVDLDPEAPGDDVSPVAERLHEKYGGIRVFSGRGYQIWLKVGDDADRDGILRAIRAEVTECKVDTVHDEGRLARLPGTVNLKTGRRAEVLSVKPSRPPEPLSRPKRVQGQQRASSEEIASLLEVLDPDMDYPDWLKVGMALHHAGQDIGVWESWSSKGEKYEEGCCERWYGFSSDTENPVTVGTLRRMAYENGWDPVPFLREHQDGNVLAWLEGAGLLTSELCKEVGVNKSDAKKKARAARVARKVSELPRNEARYTADDCSWWFNHDPHGWQRIYKQDLDTLLGEGAKEIRRALLEESWIQVAEPFEEEELEGRRWNRTGAQLIEPMPGDFPTIKAAFDRLEEALGVRGYLFHWAAFMVQNPKGKLPVLFLYSSEQATGKSSFGLILKSMFKRGAVDGSGVLRGDSGSRFTNELEGAVLCYYDEEKSSKAGMDKLKKLVTEPEFLSEGKGMNRRLVPNHLHFVVTSNHPDTLQLDLEDERVVMIYVPPLENPTPREEWEARVQEEAPAFLDYLLNMDLPEPVGRLQLPVISTDVKEAVASRNSGRARRFFKERFPAWLTMSKRDIAQHVGLVADEVEAALPPQHVAKWKVASAVRSLGSFEGLASDLAEQCGLSAAVAGRAARQCVDLGVLHGGKKDRSQGSWWKLEVVKVEEAP